MSQAHKLAFLNAKADKETINPHALATTPSPFMLLAGSVISASLITGAVILADQARPLRDQEMVAGDRVIGVLCHLRDRHARQIGIDRRDHGRVGARRLLYILGVREHTDKLVRELVLDDRAPFVPLTTKKRCKETDYKAKTVTLAGRRYIVAG